jgi:DNA invertase Pin-like site-specific DNA recombinase
MNEFDKPPKVLTLKDLYKDSGIPYPTIIRRIQKGRDPLVNVRDKRLDKLEGMTQSEVARKFGVSRQRVSERLKIGFILKKGEWTK